jgi:hypothetical protein
MMGASMRPLTLLALVLFAFGAMLYPAPEAYAGAWLKDTPQDSLPSIVHKVESAATKKQKALNKSCGPGKVFFEGKGCIDRQKAEEKKQKQKERESAKQAPPPPVQQHCEIFKAGTGGGLGCASGPTTCNKLANGDTQCCCPK